MDLELYQQLFRRYWLVFASITLVVGGLALVMAMARPITWTGATTLAIAQPEPVLAPTPTTDDFGSFYTIQGSGFVADFVAGWFHDPAAADNILTAGGAKTSQLSLSQLKRALSVESRGRVNLLIEFKHEDPSVVRAVLEEASRAAQTRLTSLHDQGLYQDFRLVAGSAVARANPSGVVASALFGLVAGAVLGFAVLLVLSLGLPSSRD
ncbi:hypothetical protein HY375_01220 [Candidatus Berkelbacteria bacterium]|nr:hypothetical protein [Candidatus Berkelbacteria bacterium]